MKKSKMTVCKHCGQEIAVSAKTCPHCGGKNKKPIFLRWWFWLLIVIIILIFGMAGGGDSGSGTQKIGEVNSGTSADISADNEESALETADVQTVYYVGDILQDGDVQIVYMSSGDYSEDSDYLQPDEGMKYIYLQFAFINTSESSDNYVSFYDFNCYADGYACDMYYSGDDTFSATLSAGKSVSGYVYFTVPEEAEEIEVEYETNWITEEKITFVFEGEKDSGYTLEKNTAATEGALHVGDTTESDGLSITYVACYEDTSDNMFISPKDGYHYVTCEFEFENNSNSDESVSYFSFDCYADGIVCDAAYFRDDQISASLSSGRKASGTVTFEVPDDATIVEVEYLTNFWTSGRVVFDATDAEN